MSDVKPELVIIRRRSAFEDNPSKGGVWKIAYADFMTAMMAFFLVMWLLNALKPEQREVVASYFNPIRLSENSPAPKGLKDPANKEPSPSDGQEGRQKPAGPSTERRGDSPTSEKPPYYEEKALFRDPYATLSEIVASSNDASGQRRIGAMASAEENGMKGGEAYRDPFDPGYWKLAPQAPQDAGRTGTEPDPNSESNANSNSVARENAGEKQDGPLVALGIGADDSGGAAEGKAAASSETASPLLPPGAAPMQPDREGRAQANSAAQSAAVNAAKEPEKRDAVPAQDTAQQLQAAISEALSDIKAGAKPVAEVRQVDEGLLVSLTDDASFGMFAVGSAEPRADLIRVIDKIGPLLMKRAGAIIVRGHTDNRQYRSENYDNWRLSTARAQMAYYMLVRSGVDPQRIEHVEGYAERRPKIPSDPAAAQNRRIEILIREKRP